MIQRQLYQTINKKPKGKAIVLIGPRQVGKTTLIKLLLGEENYLFLDGDDPKVRSLLANINTQELKNLIGDEKLVFIDECQRIENLGITAKIIVDQIKSTQLYLSGSSAFELNDQISEPLTGRKWTHELFPVTYLEWEQNIGKIEALQDLENRLVFGFYPDVLNNPKHQKDILDELAESYLFKDILAFSNIKRSDIIHKLVKALAFQIGSEVNYNELSNLIGVDNKTIVNYIDILEKAYVVFRLKSFSRNERTEIKKGVKIYFYDNGIRNAIINNYSTIDLRNDIGPLWENFLISERRKQLKYNKTKATTFFWRTFQQQEIDYIEELNGHLHTYEFKWNTKKKARLSATFSSSYESTFEEINPRNFSKFVS